MPFGADPWGAGRWGRGRWAERAVWGSIQPGYQSEDEKQGSPLRRTLLPIEDVLEEYRDLISALHHQADGRRVRAAWDVEEEFDIVSTSAVTVAGYPGHLIESVISGATPIEDVGAGWIVHVAGSRYTVVKVRLRTDEQRLWLRGPGPLSAATHSARAHAQPLLERLGADEGIGLDELERPEDQRAAISSVTEFTGWVGAGRGYEIRGSVAGMDIVARGLYAIRDDVVAMLPSDRTFQATVDGETRWYTDIDPRPLRMDDFQADWLTDIGLWDMDVWLHDRDGSWDKTQAVMTIDVTASIPLSDADKATAGLPSGLRVTAEYDPAESERVLWDAVDAFVLVPVDGDRRDGLFVEHVFTPLGPAFGDGPVFFDFAIGTADGVTLSPGTYQVAYWPDIAVLPYWLRSNAIRVEITPQDGVVEYLESPAAVRRAVSRVIEKLDLVKPEHVRVIQYVHVIQTEIDMSATVTGDLAAMVVTGDVWVSRVFDEDPDSDPDAPLDDRVVLVYE